jgi:hypothetical protein
VCKNEASFDKKDIMTWGGGGEGVAILIRGFTRPKLTIAKTYFMFRSFAMAVFEDLFPHTDINPIGPWPELNLYASCRLRIKKIKMPPQKNKDNNNKNKNLPSF